MTTIIFTHWAMNKERSRLSRESLKSLEASLSSPCEIIVVDNGGSFEDSKFFLEECDKKRISQYVRNADNFNLGYARNQAMALAKGEYIVIVDNDLEYQSGWLEKCIEILQAFHDRKIIATPIGYPDVCHKRVKRYDAGEIAYNGEAYPLSTRAGSNCFVMRRETMQELGEFKNHYKTGSLYADKIIHSGYLIAVLPKQMVFDKGLRQGFNFRGKIKFKKTLSDGKEYDL